MSVPDPVLTPQEVADELRVSVHTVRQWLREGHLPGARHGNLWFIRRSTVDEFLKPTNVTDVA